MISGMSFPWLYHYVEFRCAFPLGVSLCIIQVCFSRNSGWREWLKDMEVSNDLISCMNGPYHTSEQWKVNKILVQKFTIAQHIPPYKAHITTGICKNPNQTGLLVPSNVQAWGGVYCLFVAQQCASLGFSLLFIPSAMLWVDPKPVRWIWLESELCLGYLKALRWTWLQVYEFKMWEKWWRYMW
jgi:hypothetical protein